MADAFFALLDPAMDERIEKRGDKYHIDLKAINRLWLLRAGIDPSRVDVHPDCTKCHPERYWSHRAMGDQRGGMAAMICLTEEYAVKRRLSALLCALTLALSLSGCWSGDVSDDSSGDFWEETPPVEADTSSTLTPITSFALPYLQGVTLDPITCPDGMQQTLGALLYEGLFVLDESFAPQNVLCSRYEHNDDCTSYTFYLRDGVSFSDGSSLMASDVLATLRRAQESERYSARFANVASMRASNGALIVNLTRADSAFPALLDIPIVKSGSEKNTVPLGTGPYLFVTDSDGACLKQNPDWRSDGTLPFERIELRAVKDADTASYLFSSREVHLLSARPDEQHRRSAQRGHDAHRLRDSEHDLPRLQHTARAALRRVASQRPRGCDRPRDHHDGLPRWSRRGDALPALAALQPLSDGDGVDARFA